MDEIEITPEMIEAGAVYLQDCCGIVSKEAARSIVEDILRASLAKLPVVVKNPFLLPDGMKFKNVHRPFKSDN